MTLRKPDICCSQNIIKINKMKENSDFDHSWMHKLLILARSSDKSRMRDMFGCALLKSPAQPLKFTIANFIYKSTARITFLLEYYKSIWEISEIG